ncbi:hypothetical protein [Pseudomonas aeruginosa]|uniref:hypothetical protein n=1 Tax=Pseudomonas aeruginosa TaxID=287 RepID=UPI000FC41C43|nr:hypothetical protein [Pseudomonas aeruginosa]KAA5674995.1 hypothetical protein F3G62_08220 [Pseudomonas aeruginosa]MBH8949637.1 hypothetical protein [Pseudomonas aeruginosa]RUI49038.1 hypothetical protein IPC397_15885 [Pseudomonas aeruginosa]UGR19985.1 hypothetical protein LSP19_16285 [Pseudomonas aeruginosa]HBO9739895.1 hypothetical protein [Pseudomonas aeruginosa]
MSEEIQNTLEKIHRQLSGGETDLFSNREKSIKYHLSNISSDLGKWLRDREQESYSRKYNTNLALGILAIIAVFLIRLGAQENPDFDWVEQNKLSIKIWGIIIAAIYVGASIERSELFKSIWKFSFTKLIVSIAASGLIVYSTGKAASAVNSVFGVDASSFPVTLVFTTAIILFHLIAPFLFAISAAIFVHLLVLLAWIKAKLNDKTYELPPFHSFMFSIASAVIMYYGWEWSKNELSKERLPEKIYLMAYALDFNGKHHCKNIKKDVSVVFLGANQKSVLATPSALEDFDFSTFFTASVYIPSQFYRLECEYPDYQTNE